ncbi:nitroreductase family protein [Pararhodobacter zhoushanensis]|uniref:Putative NAD(P)H nitroreductase n=1 Tax=Pararhodobacter zhoushanensis TaxID=2479545 RepID=A0ABT3H1H2_9RHOB|nr:nitroreductase [Pararhodobacter zhoushanensis]MCW1933618.1 nitroreductase [Pararhodobacter zhoushanensis]
MSQTNPVMEFLLTRRSRPAAALKAPAPEGAELDLLLTAASRVPDHGALVPWRFLILENAARLRLAGLIRERGPELGIDPAKIEKSAKSWENAPLIVGVVSAPVPSEKAPELEQVLTAGAVCTSLVNAALSSGWGAAWITGWAAFDRVFMEQGLGLQAQEKIAGFVHLGSCETPPSERARPDLSALITRVVQ